MLEDLERSLANLRSVNETIDSLEQCSLPKEIQFGDITTCVSEDTAAKIKDLLLEDRKRARDDAKTELVWTMEQLEQELELELQDE